MELLDLLTNEDKETFEQYVLSYAIKAERIDLKVTLNAWNEQKKKLYKLLGNNLRIKIPVKIKTEDIDHNTMLREAYSNPPYDFCFDFIQSYELEVDKRAKNAENDFIDNLYLFFYNRLKEFTVSLNDVKAIFTLLGYKNLKEKYLSFVGDNGKYCFVYNGKILEVKTGQKTIKTIQTVLRFYDYDRFDLFEVFRNRLSNVSTKANIDGTLVLSIHPIDYLTLSDNNCGWLTCLSLMDGGDYRTGVVDMLNSDCAIIAYLESDKDFVFNFHKIPNKSWRCLFYVHNKILLGGKSYPYGNDDLTIFILDKLRELAYNNLKLEYKSSLQIYSNVEESKKSNGILIDTKNMYNDIVEDDTIKYYCYRNDVENKLSINVSGGNTCFLCGKIHHDNDYFVCGECIEKFMCDKCEYVYPLEEIYTLNVFNKFVCGTFKQRTCKDCLKDYFYDEKTGIAYCKPIDFFKGFIFYGDNVKTKIENSIDLYISLGKEWRSDSYSVQTMTDNELTFLKNTLDKYGVKYIVANLSPYLVQLLSYNCYKMPYYTIKEGVSLFQVKDAINEWENKKLVSAYDFFVKGGGSV